MYNLSELIKTDCCIDCGTNEKLREVVRKMTIPPTIGQIHYGIEPSDAIIVFRFYGYFTVDSIPLNLPAAIPLTSINIDL